MRIIQVTVEFDVYKVGECIEVEDQVACDAIAQGYAVPSVEALPGKSFNAAPENRAFDAAPEVK